MKFVVLASALALSVVAQGCAVSSGDAPEEGASQEAVTAPAASDAALKAKLKELIGDATFMSESDYEYVVLEGEGGAKVTRISSSIIRKRLGAVVKAESQDHRDLVTTPGRHEREDVNTVIANADEGADDASADESQRNHDRRLAATLKYMKKNLRAVTGYTFGLNDVGDGDGEGNALIIYVGVSKTTGKLIAIMTEAVYT